MFESEEVYGEWELGKRVKNKIVVILQKRKKLLMTLPALLAAAKPRGPAEAEGCGTGDGLAIHPARDVGRAAGVG